MKRIRGLRGSQRKFFGQPQTVVDKLLKACVLTEPNLEDERNRGFARIGKELWQAQVIQACAPDYYWVGVKRAHSLRWSYYPSPTRRTDVPAMLKALCPSVEFKNWSSEKDYSKPWGMPWPMLHIYTKRAKPKTFVAYAPSMKQLLVTQGAWGAHLGKLRKVHPGLMLLGMSGRPVEKVRARLDGRLEGVPKPSTLKRVAKLTSLHTHVMLKKGAVHAAD